MAEMFTKARASHTSRSSIMTAALRDVISDILRTFPSAARGTEGNLRDVRNHVSRISHLQQAATGIG